MLVYEAQRLRDVREPLNRKHLHSPSDLLKGVESLYVIADNAIAHNREVGGVARESERVVALPAAEALKPAVRIMGAVIMTGQV